MPIQLLHTPVRTVGDFERSVTNTDFIVQTQTPGPCYGSGGMRSVIPYLMNGSILIGSGGLALSTDNEKESCRGPFQEISDKLGA